MSTRTICDGCGKDATNARSRDDEVAISGARANRMGGGGLPSGTFDWCHGCALVAFSAVADHRRVGSGE